MTALAQRLQPEQLGPVVKRSFFALLPMLLMVLFVKVSWPSIPAEIYLVGTIQGALVALIALGFVLVYRANRIVNFAAADLGAAPASLALLLFASLGWNIYLSAATGFVAAIALGVIVEFVFLRRFFAAPRLIMTVATIGVTEILAALALLMPQWFGSPDVQTYDPFINAHFKIGQLVVFDGNDIMVLVVVPLVLIALALFFQFSTVGVALRATAENADRASLLGVPVRRLQSVVWGIAALLAYIAMFLRIGVGGQVLGRVLDPAVLLTALGAALIGRLERMPTVVFAAVGLGIIDQAAVFHYDNVDVDSIAIRAAIIAVALLWQRADSVGRLASSATSTWQATREIKRVPAELRREPAVRATYWGLGIAGAALVLLLPVILRADDKIKLSATVGIYAIIGLSLVVLTGWAGQLSLGQMGFVGISGAVAGTLANRYHWDTGLILLVGGIVGALLTIAVGIPTLRARGLAFAVVTLAFSLAATNYFLNSGYSPFKSWVPANGVDRMHVLGVIRVDTETRFYYLVLVVLVICMLMVRSLRASRIGRVLIGVRDNERAAEAFSVGTRNTLVLAFAMSGFLSGLAGALFVLQQRALDAQNFDPGEGLRVFSMVVVGGLGSIGGAIIGAIYVKGTQYFLTQPEWAFLSTGIGLLLILLLMPGGIGAAIGDARDGALRWYARRKGIRVPSLVADTRLEPTPDVDVAAVLTDAVANPEMLADTQLVTEAHE